MDMQVKYKNKIATITGGSSGIGRELSKQLAAQGAVIIIGARAAKPAEVLVREIQEAGGNASYVPVDIRSAASCQAFFDAIVKKNGHIDYAFNCAGVIMGGEIRDNALVDLQNVLTTNVLGTTYCAYDSYRIMTTQGYGHIINFSSGAGIFPLPLMGVYSASKFAIFGLTEAMRIEGKALGVKVSAVVPGLVDTPIYDTAVYSKADADTSRSLLRKGVYMIQPDQAARKILRGTLRGKAIIHTQGYVHFSWLVYRLAPWLFRFFAGRLLPLYRKRLRKSAKLR